MGVRAPHGAYVRQAKLCLRVWQVSFLEVLSFFSHRLLIGASPMSLNNLERDIKLNKQ